MCKKNLNIFESQTNMSQRKIKAACYYSYSFYVSMVIALAITFFWYALMGVNVSLVEQNPSYDTFEDMSSECGYTPFCECSNIATSVGEIIGNTAFYTDSWCEEAKGKMSHCQADQKIFDAIGTTCMDTQVGSTLAGVNTLCTVGVEIRDTLVEQWKLENIVSSHLLSDQVLDKRINATVVQVLSSLSAITNGIVKGTSALSAVDRPRLSSFNDINETTVQNNPSQYSPLGSFSLAPISLWSIKGTDCQCDEGWNCQININIPTDPPFTATRTCSLFQTIMNNKLSVWSYKEWYRDAMGVDVDVNDFGQQLYDEIWSDSGSGVSLLFPTESSYLDDSMAVAFANGFIDYSDLVVEANMKTYFNSCKPKECVCIVKGSRDLIDIFVVLFGLIGGFNAVLMKIFTIIYGIHSKNIDAAENKKGNVSNAHAAGNTVQENSKNEEENKTGIETEIEIIAEMQNTVENH